MTMHSRPVTDAENAAFDTTMKITGMVIGLVAVAVAVIWYFGG
jgi:hypothetical protein